MSQREDLSSGAEAYEAYQEGSRLLASDDSHAAAVVLERARDLEPDKGSIREALGRAYFRSARFADASTEFERALELDPVNDYAHFGLGLAKQRTGDVAAARRHLKLAVAMRPLDEYPRHSPRSLTRNEVSRSHASGGVLCCDLDGVVWRGEEPIAPAISAIGALRSAGVRVGFVSNNSSQPIGEVVAKLEACGVAAEPADVLTSAVAAAHLLAHSLPSGSPVLACAGPGVIEALEAVGLRPVDRGPAKAVVVGFHRSFDFDELDRASSAVRAGARFISTNLDATYPVPGGLMPGSGSITATVAVASGCEPEVAGKPEAPMVDLVRERFGPTGIVVGDRPSSDGALAATLGWPFALVLTGITAPVAPAGGEAVPDPPPPFVGDDLGALVPALLAALARPA